MTVFVRVGIYIILTIITLFLLEFLIKSFYFILERISGFYHKLTGKCDLSWYYGRNPYKRFCKVCNKEQHQWRTAGINFFGKVIYVDRWEDM